MSRSGSALATRCLCIVPVHPHLQGCLQPRCSGWNDALRADADWDVVKERLGQLLLYLEVTRKSQDVKDVNVREFASTTRLIHVGFHQVRP
jgi:hypothetical protein